MEIDLQDLTDEQLRELENQITMEKACRKILYRGQIITVCIDNGNQIISRINHIVIDCRGKSKEDFDHFFFVLYEDIENAKKAIEYAERGWKT